MNELRVHVPGEIVDSIADAVAERLLSAATPPTEREWRLLNVEEAAARLGRSTRWLRERAKCGDVPYVRLDGGALAFEVADLQAFAAARRVDDTAQTLAAALAGAEMRHG